MQIENDEYVIGTLEAMIRDQKDLLRLADEETYEVEEDREVERWFRHDQIDILQRLVDLVKAHPGEVARS